MRISDGSSDVCSSDLEQQRAAVAASRHVAGQSLVEEVGQRVDLVPRDGEARRHRMTAARDEQAAVLRGQHRRAEIDARNRPARPLTDAITIECDDDDGAAELFLHPPGANPDHTSMPPRSKAQTSELQSLITN